MFALAMWRTGQSCGKRPLERAGQWRRNHLGGRGLGRVGLRGRFRRQKGNAVEKSRRSIAAARKNLATFRFGTFPDLGICSTWNKRLERTVVLTVFHVEHSHGPDLSPVVPRGTKCNQGQFPRFVRPVAAIECHTVGRRTCQIDAILKDCS